MSDHVITMESLHNNCGQEISMVLAHNNFCRFEHDSGNYTKHFLLFKSITNTFEVWTYYFLNLCLNILFSITAEQKWSLYFLHVGLSIIPFLKFNSLSLSRATVHLFSTYHHELLNFVTYCLRYCLQINSKYCYLFLKRKQICIQVLLTLKVYESSSIVMCTSLLKYLLKQQ